MDVQLAPRSSVPFADPDQSVGTLSAEAAARVVAAAGDVAFVLDADGVIVDHAVSNAALAQDNFGDWVDRRLADMVTPDSRAKIVDLLADAAAGRVGRWRQVNHRGADGNTIAIRYLVVDPGHGGYRIAIGRDLREAASLQQRLLQAQQSMERDYVRLRQAESRYRLLFDLAAEAILIIDAATGRLVEVNPAAQRVLGVATDAAVGTRLDLLLAPADRDAAQRLLAAVAAGGSPIPVAVQLARGPVGCTLSATLFRQEQTAYLLARLTPDGAATLTDRDPRQLLLDVIERIPDAFVVTDDALGILAENTAFLELAQLVRREQARGVSLERLLGRPGIDLGLIVAHLREHGVVRNFATVFRSMGGGEDAVEVSAVSVADGPQPYFGFAIRMTARRLAVETAAPGRDLPRSVEQLTELVGRVSLKDIVRESTDLIERLCIEAALTYTSDNRASAAEILGLSRQSLYSKLHRHGLGNLAGGED